MTMPNTAIASDAWPCATVAACGTRRMKKIIRHLRLLSSEGEIPKSWWSMLLDDLVQRSITDGLKGALSHLDMILLRLDAMQHKFNLKFSVSEGENFGGTAKALDWPTQLLRKVGKKIINTSSGFAVKLVDLDIGVPDKHARRPQSARARDSAPRRPERAR
jgi:hypothetical protein